MPRGCLLLLSSIAAVVAGCGGEGQLTLRLLQPGFEDSFQQVVAIGVRVLGPDLEPRSELGAGAVGDRLDLGLLSPEPQRLEVQGRGNGLVLARGITRLLSPAAEGSLEEVLPFARPGSAAIASTSKLQSPAVDGSLREWLLSPSLILDENAHLDGPAGSGPRDLRAEVYLAWSESELRFAVQVIDDCPILRVDQATPCGSSSRPDRVALGVDGLGDGGPALLKDDLWVEIEPTRATAIGEVTQADLAVVMARLPDGKGWAVEGALRLGALRPTPLKAGDHLGLDLVIIDEDPGQPQATRLSWSGWKGGPGAPTPPSSMGKIGPGKSGR